MSHSDILFIFTYVIIIIFIIQSLGRFGQRPELSQATGMALVRCILGKFLGVVCHCFPPFTYLCIYEFLLTWSLAETMQCEGLVTNWK